MGVGAVFDVNRNRIVIQHHLQVFMPDFLGKVLDLHCVGIAEMGLAEFLGKVLDLHCVGRAAMGFADTSPNSRHGAEFPGLAISTDWTQLYIGPKQCCIIEHARGCPRGK
jgi:hypothetical protein